MKKVVLISFLTLLSLTLNAQGIYSKMTKYDKFDDVVWTKNIKTLITKTDSTITFETKGSKPDTYRYLNAPFLASHIGSRDSLANLVADVWGYETEYIAITEDIVKEVYEEVEKQIRDKSDTSVSEEEINMLMGISMLKRLDDLPKITIRTVSKFEYYFDYKTEIIWIRFKDGSRIIYYK